MRQQCALPQLRAYPACFDGAVPLPPLGQTAAIK